MVKIDNLEKEGKVSRIIETELERYVQFFTESYKDNFHHAESNIEKYPRWSIISGYYAMHDISKLFIAKIYRLKIEKEVHATTIKVLREVIKAKETLKLIEDGYEEFRNLADELNDAKKERVKAQYYTGTAFMKEKYAGISKDFIENTVKPYLAKISILLDEGKNDN